MFLSKGPDEHTEYLSQRLIAGLTQTEGGESIVDLIKARQNADGGFGDFLAYGSSVYTTFWALSALKAANFDAGLLSEQAINYLKAQQNPDGSWSMGTYPDDYLSARIVSLFAQYRSQIAVCA